MVAIYNPTYKQALKRRFDNILKARQFAIGHFMNVEPAFRLGFRAPRKGVARA